MQTETYTGPVAFFTGLRDPAAISASAGPQKTIGIAIRVEVTPKSLQMWAKLLSFERIPTFASRFP
jgi:hypothetical protein